MPHHKTTAEDIADALKDTDKPVLDAEGIGEKLGVTATTIRNRKTAMEEHEEIASMKIGQATVWWYCGPPDDREPLSGPEMADTIEEHGEYDLPVGLPPGSEADEQEQQEAVGEESEPSTEPTGVNTVTLVEGLASPRTILFGGFLLVLSVLLVQAALATGGTLALYLIGFGFVLSLVGTAAISVAAIAQIALGLPLRGLRPTLEAVRK